MNKDYTLYIDIKYRNDHKIFSIHWQNLETNENQILVSDKNLDSNMMFDKKYRSNNRQKIYYTLW